jgi:uncharacterized RDD family membrane protein YckC
MSDYSVKWKGQTSGPFSLDDLRRRFESREIGGMHEVFVDGKWITVRAFFRSLQPAEPAVVPPGPSSPPPPLTPPMLRANPGAPPFLQPPPPPPYPSLGLGAGWDAVAAEDSGLLVFAGFWARTTATVIDAAILLGLPFLVIDTLVRPGFVTRESLEALSLAQWIGVASAFLLVWFFYSAASESSPLCGTPGKRCLGLLVVAGDGTRIPFSTAALRFACKLMAAVPGFAGLFLAAFSPRKQALHDQLTTSFVCARFPGERIFTPDHNIF